MSKLFISHSSKDKVFVKKLGEDLMAHGYDVWLDEWEIKVGDCIISKIEKGLEESKYIVLCMSKSAVESGWVDKEWKAKYWDEVKTKKISVLPILLEDCAVPELLKTKKYADFSNNYSVGIIELTNALSPILRGDSSEPNLNAIISRTNAEIANVLSKIQTRDLPLEESITEVLKLAVKTHDRELLDFCTGELKGWTNNPENKPHYRFAQVYVSLYQLNLLHFGMLGGNTAAFQYMENDEKFYSVKMFFNYPISKMVDNVAGVSELDKKIFSLTGPAVDLFPDIKDPKITMYIYGDPHIFGNILSSIRSKMVEMLIDRLPIANKTDKIK